MLGKWLKCGFVFKQQLFPTNEGTPQGGIISPVLANMTLDGMQTLLSCYQPTTKDNRRYSPKEMCIRDRAISSLPVPFSPVIRTFASVTATFFIMVSKRCMAGDFPQQISSSF